MPSKVDDLTNKPDTFIQCYSLRHSWDDDGYFYHHIGTMKGVCRVLVCRRCDTERRDYFFPSGELSVRRYYYPENYAKQGDGKVTARDIFRELMDRTKIYNTPKEAGVESRQREQDD